VDFGSVVGDVLHEISPMQKMDVNGKSL